MGRYLGRESTYGAFEKQILNPDGTTREFVLNHEVGSSGSILVVYSVSGITKILEPGFDYGITESGKKIQFSVAPADDGDDERLYIIYMGKQLLVPAIPGRSPLLVQSTGDGTKTAFDITVESDLTHHGLIVFKDGTQQRHLTHFSVDGKQIIFNSAPTNGALLDFYVFGGLEKHTLDVSEIVDGEITPEKLNLSYNKDYKNTISVQTLAGMNSSTSIQEAKYQDLGNIVRVKLKFSIALTGTPDNKIRFSLPISNSGDTNISATCVVSSNESLESGIVRWASISEFDVYRQSAVNYTINKTYTIEATVEYEKEQLSSGSGSGAPGGDM